jgi:hypothetical protein
MSFSKLNNAIRQIVRPSVPVFGSQLIRAIALTMRSSTQEAEALHLASERHIQEVEEEVKVIENILQQNDLTEMQKFRQTKANQVNVSGSTKQSLLSISKGTNILTPDEMGIGKEYHGEAWLLVSYDSEKSYDFFLSVGGQEVDVNIPVATTGLIENVMVRLSWHLIFYAGPANERAAYFLGKYELIDNESDFLGSYHRRIPVTDLEIDATQPQPFDLLFQGTDSANTCQTIDLRLSRL